MADCKSTIVPADPHTDLMAATDDSEGEKVDHGLYREAVGSLLYVAISKRPDISFAVNQVAQFCSAPLNSHWEAVKRIFRYLKGTQSHGLCFSGSSNPNLLTTYSDADYASDTRNRRSTSGFILLMNGAAIAWSSQKQRCQSLDNRSRICRSK